MHVFYQERNGKHKQNVIETTCFFFWIWLLVLFLFIKEIVPTPS